VLFPPPRPIKPTPLKVNDIIVLIKIDLKNHVSQIMYHFIPDNFKYSLFKKSALKILILFDNLPKIIILSFLFVFRPRDFLMLQ
jgi:hypothetical protein